MTPIQSLKIQKIDNSIAHTLRRIGIVDGQENRTIAFEARRLIGCKFGNSEVQANKLFLTTVLIKGGNPFIRVNADLFPAVTKFLGAHTELCTLALVVCEEADQRPTGFDAAMWGLTTSYSRDHAANLAAWLILRSIAVLTLDYAAALRDPVPFLNVRPLSLSWRSLIVTPLGDSAGTAVCRNARPVAAQRPHSRRARVADGAGCGRGRCVLARADGTITDGVPVRAEKRGLARAVHRYVPLLEELLLTALQHALPQAARTASRTMSRVHAPSCCLYPMQYSVEQITIRDARFSSLSTDSIVKFVSDVFKSEKAVQNKSIKHYRVVAYGATL
ncbi:hypothetical protein B0H11DRAFT_2281348 [Mycena galericulata]|nr:hypothetical protein B0H11DRAFT_2281348 [Mycena galericulata]